MTPKEVRRYLSMFTANLDQHMPVAAQMLAALYDQIGHEQLHRLMQELDSVDAAKAFRKCSPDVQQFICLSAVLAWQEIMRRDFEQVAEKIV